MNVLNLPVRRTVCVVGTTQQIVHKGELSCALPLPLCFNHRGGGQDSETIVSTNGCDGDFPSPQKVSHCHYSEHIKAGDGTPKQKTSQSTAEIPKQVLFHIQLVCPHTRMARLVLFLFSLGLAAAQPAQESRVIGSGIENTINELYLCVMCAFLSRFSTCR